MKRSLLCASLLLIAACGDDASTGDDAMPDAAPGACAGLGTPAGTIDSFPGTFSGTVAGEGADLTVAEGTCTTDDWYDNSGEDTVVYLTGLQSGAKYAIVLESDDDLGFYLLSGCDVADGVVGGGCDLFEDVNPGGEEHTFVASGETAWVVVDTSLANADLASGDFTLNVLEAECEMDSECSGGTPKCVAYTCVECATDFDCTAATPSCNQTNNTCVAGFDGCTGDDAGDSTPPGDDGPTVAAPIALPTAGVPTVVDAAVCSLPSSEADWYTFTVAVDGTYTVTLDWTSTEADLDVYLLDADGAIVDAGVNFDQEPEGFLSELGAGTYFLMVTEYAPAATAAANSYTLTFAIPECLDNFDCGVGEPICSTAGDTVGTCGAGPAECTNDDAGDTATGGDDGPGGARDLTVVGTLTGNGICNVGDGEADFYKVTVVQGGSLTVTLHWLDDTKDLDVYVLDADGVILGASFWKRDEVVDLTFLPAGTYYIQVSLFSAADITDASSVPYDITAALGAVGVCVNAASCASTYSTQVYRGDCVAGACQFITTLDGADNTACDTADDCHSGTCSYILFEKDAEKSVCTTACTTTTDCAALTGTTCTTGFMTNLCLPACGDDLSCGADLGSETIDTGEPWDYYVCTTPGASGTCGP